MHPEAGAVPVLRHPALPGQPAARGRPGFAPEPRLLRRWRKLGAPVPRAVRIAADINDNRQVDRDFGGFERVDPLPHAVVEQHEISCRQPGDRTSIRAHRDVDRGVALWNKTGTDSGVRADVGAVRSEDRAIAYAVLAEWQSGADPSVRDTVLDAMREIGRRLRSDLERDTSTGRPAEARPGP